MEIPSNRSNLPSFQMYIPTTNTFLSNAKPNLTKLHLTNPLVSHPQPFSETTYPNTFSAVKPSANQKKQKTKTKQTKNTSSKKQPSGTESHLNICRRDPQFAHAKLWFHLGCQTHTWSLAEEMRWRHHSIQKASLDFTRAYGQTVLILWDMERRHSSTQITYWSLLFDTFRCLEKNKKNKKRGPCLCCM